MDKLFHIVLNYKDFHPIRFCFILIVISAVLLICLYLINRWIKSSFFSLKNDSTKSKKGIKIKNRTVLVFIAITILVTLLVQFYNPTKIFNRSEKLVENTWITNSKKNFGIDISHYQGSINWDTLISSDHKINYIFIRASMGADGQDYHFKRNWKKSKEKNYLRGAYHYYRPNENSVTQFRNFSNIVKLEPGDLPPVLDIEEMSKYGTENLIAGVLNWLKLAEEHYGVIPIVYTGSNFYKRYLRGRIELYPLWIAAYSHPNRINDIRWQFHQFSDKIMIKGINNSVDGNSFSGEFNDLLDLCI